MSFAKTLAALAAGFAAAKGYDKFKDMGGMAGVKEMVKSAGAPGGMIDRMGESAEKMGLPGGAKVVREMYDRFGGASEAAEAGLGGLLASMTSAATAGGRAMTDMMGAMADANPAPAIAEQNAKLMIRAMIQAAKADGEIDADERQKILDHLGDAGDEEIAFVAAELDRPLDIAGLAQATDETMRAQVYSTSLMAIRVDNPGERAYLDQLAAALRLDEATRVHLHTAMGVPAG